MSLSSVIIVVSGLALLSVPLYEAYQKSRNKKRKISTQSIVIFLFGSLGVIGGGVATYQQDKDNEQNKREVEKRDAKIIGLQNEQRSLLEDQNNLLKEQKANLTDQLHKSEEIAELNRKIADAQIQLRQKSDEISALTESSNSLITGGESFCYAYLEFENINDKAGNKDAAVYVIHEGEFPLYSISMTIVEVGVIEMLASGASVEYRNSREFFKSMAMQKMMMSQSFKVGDLGTNKAKLMGEISLSGEENLKIEIKFSSPRNGSWSQIAFIEREIDKNGKSKVTKNTYRIEKYIQKPNGEGFNLIKESSPTSFPYRNKELVEPWLN